MNILVTGAKGFVGKNLVASLNNIKKGKDRTRSVIIDEVFEYDIDTESTLLVTYCEKADFVFNLAGVNRPKDNAEFMAGNFGFASTLLDTLKKHRNTCPVMLSSSIQATLIGRYAASDYGKSKLAGEELFFDYAKEAGAKVLIYRFPNLFGKWCRPNYNSAVATFCNNIANDLPIQVNDRNAELELLYIDDLVALKDVLTVIDDFRPATRLDGETMKGKMQTLARGYGDRAGRNRLNPNITLQDERVPQGNAIDTAEFLPVIGELGIARIFCIDMRPKQIQLACLTDVQRMAEEDHCAAQCTVI